MIKKNYIFKEKDPKQDYEDEVTRSKRKNMKSLESFLTCTQIDQKFCYGKMSSLTELGKKQLSSVS